MKAFALSGFLLLIASCVFPPEPTPQSTVFQNGCPYDIDVHTSKNGASAAFVLKQGKTAFFDGLIDKNQVFYLKDSIKKDFDLSTQSTRHHKRYTACPDNFTPESP